MKARDVFITLGLAGCLALGLGTVTTGQGQGKGGGKGGGGGGGTTSDLPVTAAFREATPLFSDALGAELANFSLTPPTEPYVHDEGALAVIVGTDGSLGLRVGGQEKVGKGRLGRDFVLKFDPAECAVGPSGVGDCTNPPPPFGAVVKEERVIGEDRDAALLSVHGQNLLTLRNDSEGSGSAIEGLPINATLSFQEPNDLGVGGWLLFWGAGDQAVEHGCAGRTNQLLVSYYPANPAPGTDTSNFPCSGCWVIRTGDFPLTCLGSWGGGQWRGSWRQSFELIVRPK
jgi:hypothetical protein